MKKIKSIEVIDIIEEYLYENKYDGLCNEGCGCSKDNLAPCGEIQGDCMPAYKWICDPENCNQPGENCDLMSKGDFCYRTEKPRKI